MKYSFIKKSTYLLVLMLLFIVLYACDNIDDPVDPILPVTLETYTLLSKTIDAADITDTFVYDIIELHDEGVVILSSLDIYGLNIQEGTYVKIDGMITISIGLRNLQFVHDESEQTLTYEGRINRKQVFMQYMKNITFEKPKTTGDALFTEQLFGESLDENFFNYAPTIVMEGTDTMHIWFCGNRESQVITDHIVYRIGKLQGDGRWTFSDAEYVLEPTAGAWDSRHTCDPSVIKGEFAYHGETYHYLMSYLGCITNNSSRNEVGIAVAKNIGGPWIKVDEINPIANYYEADEYVDDRWTWGYGQPSLVSVNKAGQVLLFYTKGVVSGTFQYVEHWDLSNLNAPVKLNEAQVTNSGVVNASGGTDVINNADFAYDPHTHRLYVAKEDFPHATDGGVTWLSAANTIMYLNLNPNEDFLGQTLFSGEQMRWQVITSITPNDTGFARNHNSGIVRDAYGYLINSTSLPIIYTRSDLATDHSERHPRGQWQSLHSYRFYGFIIDL